ARDRAGSGGGRDRGCCGGSSLWGTGGRAAELGVDRGEAGGRRGELVELALEIGREAGAQRGERRWRSVGRRIVRSVGRAGRRRRGRGAFGTSGRAQGAGGEAAQGAHRIAGEIAEAIERAAESACIAEHALER